MQIYGIQCDFMHGSCWNHSNFENSWFYYVIWTSDPQNHCLLGSRNRVAVNFLNRYVIYWVGPCERVRVRRQNFAGKLSIRFYNIWDCVISFNRTELDGLWYKCALKWGQTTVIGQKFVQRIGNVLQACLWMGSNWVNDSWLAGRRSRPPAKQTFCSPSHSSLAWINLDKIISKLEV